MKFAVFLAMYPELGNADFVAVLDENNVADIVVELDGEALLIKPAHSLGFEWTPKGVIWADKRK